MPSTETPNAALLNSLTALDPAQRREVAKALRGCPTPSPRCATGGTWLPDHLLDGMRAWMRRKGYRALDN
jgi:hypothetical protein